ncbi:MAG: hypothetical protein KHZ29_11415, partial [Desulfovibrionaceae bacterium]|nr:hypothetical protein [Desulfovibrionaceae bacterium]
MQNFGGHEILLAVEGRTSGTNGRRRRACRSERGGRGTAKSFSLCLSPKLAPSDMMDGRVRAIRQCLDKNGH